MKHLLYVIMLFSLVGCNSVDRPKKPENLIGKEKMSDIMYDLYILNAAKGVNRKLLERNGIIPMDYIYDKYNIDSLQFAESNTYYAYDIKTYTAIVEEVKKELKKDKKLYDRLIQEEESSKDSLQDLKKSRRDTLISK